MCLLIICISTFINALSPQSSLNKSECFLHDQEVDKQEWGCHRYFEKEFIQIEADGFECISKWDEWLVEVNKGDLSERVLGSFSVFLKNFQAFLNRITEYQLKVLKEEERKLQDQYDRHYAQEKLNEQFREYPQIFLESIISVQARIDTLRDNETVKKLKIQLEEIKTTMIFFLSVNITETRQFLRASELSKEKQKEVFKVYRRLHIQAGVSNSKKKIDSIVQHAKEQRKTTDPIDVAQVLIDWVKGIPGNGGPLRIFQKVMMLHEEIMEELEKRTPFAEEYTEEYVEEYAEEYIEELIQRQEILGVQIDDYVKDISEQVLLYFKDFIQTEKQINEWSIDRIIRKKYTEPLEQLRELSLVIFNQIQLRKKSNNLVSKGFEAFIESLIRCNRSTEQTRRWLESCMPRYQAKFHLINYRFCKARKGIKSDDEIIGKGNFGVVFSDKRGGLKKAVKIYKEHQFKEIEKSMAAVGKYIPSCVRIYSVDTFEIGVSEPYANTVIVMDQLDGTTVHNRMSDWTEEELYDYMKYIFELLIQTAQCKLIPFDLHPENIIQDTQGEFHLIDAEPWALHWYKRWDKLALQVYYQDYWVSAIKLSVLYPLWYRISPKTLPRNELANRSVQTKITKEVPDHPIYGDMLRELVRLINMKIAIGDIKVLQSLYKGIQKKWGKREEELRKQQKIAIQQARKNDKQREREEKKLSKIGVIIDKKGNRTYFPLGLSVEEQAPLSRSDQTKWSETVNQVKNSILSDKKDLFSIGQDWDIQIKIVNSQTQDKPKSLAYNRIESGKKRAFVYVDERLKHVLDSWEPSLKEDKKEVYRFIIENELRQIMMKIDHDIKQKGLSQAEQQDIDEDKLEYVSWAQTFLEPSDYDRERIRVFNEFFQYITAKGPEEKKLFQKAFSHIEFLAETLSRTSFSQERNLEVAFSQIKNELQMIHLVEEESNEPVDKWVIRQVSILRAA